MKLALLGDRDPFAAALAGPLRAAGAEIVDGQADVALAFGDAALDLPAAEAPRVARFASVPSLADELPVPAFVTGEKLATVLRALHPDVLVDVVRVGATRVPGERPVVDLSEHLHGPDPLLAAGGVPVATPAWGRETWLRHGENGLVVNWDDERGAERSVALLEHDRALLAKLRSGLEETLAGWPSLDETAATLLDALARLPEPARDLGERAETLRKRPLHVHAPEAPHAPLSRRPRLRKLNARLHK